MKNILFICRSLPYPIDKDGLSVINFRIISQIRFAKIDIISLSEENSYTINGIKNINENIGNIRIIRDKAINNKTRRLFRLISNSFFQLKTPLDDFLQKEGNNYDLIYICVPPAALYINNFVSNTPIFLNAIDSFSLLNKRFYDFHKKLYYKTLSFLYKEAERKSYNTSNIISFVSDVDESYSKNWIQKGHSITLKNGVDTEYFTMGKKSRDPQSLLFVGNFNNISNVLSVNFFCEKVFPLVVKKIPNIKLYIVGRNANFKFNNNNIIIQGYVEDIRDLYQSCTIFIAPLVSGSGIKNKILEAMSSGIPVITTDIGIDGINAAQNIHYLLANSIEDMVRAIDILITNTSMQNKLSCNARKFIEENFNWNQNIKRYLDCFKKLSKKKA